MTEYEIINTVTNVVTTSKGIVAYFKKYNVVRKYDLQMLAKDLEARNKMRHDENMKALFMLNMDILEDCTRRIEQYPNGSTLQKNAMIHFEIISNKLAKALEEY